MPPSFSGGWRAEEYAICLVEFQQKYFLKYLKEIGYIMATWLAILQKKLVKVEVDEPTHFGSMATYWVEDIHIPLNCI